MAHLVSVNGRHSELIAGTTMSALQLRESDHLEEWIISYPELVGEDLMILTSQFGRWESETNSARERPDILALDSAGQLVVIELKRSADRMIHLQAITYAALASQFTLDMLAEVHADWLNARNEEKVSTDSALRLMSEHVESDLDESLFQLPRLVLVAESFPDQVLSTVKWLDDVASPIDIECHEFALFSDGSQRTLVSFRRIFPIDDLEDRRLRPIGEKSSSAAQVKLNERRRRADTAVILSGERNPDTGELMIPDGAELYMNLVSKVKPDVIDRIEQWLLGDEQRSKVYWHNDNKRRPLEWGLEPGSRWGLTALRNEIFSRVGEPQRVFSAPHTWSYEGRTLYEISFDIDPGD